LLTLRADPGAKGNLSNFQAGEGTPTRGESGWINLPYLGGVTRLKASDGKPLFEGMAKLDQAGLLPDRKGTGGASFVLEGADAYMVSSLIYAGNPVVTLTSIPGGWQAIVSGPFSGAVDPIMIRPKFNNLGFFLPSAMDGAVMRISTPGLPSLYGLVDGAHLLLSWQALVNLSQQGNHEITLEAYSSQAGYFRVKIYCSQATGALDLTFGK